MNRHRRTIRRPSRWRRLLVPSRLRREARAVEPADFLSAGGRMAVRILEKDWSGTPLGPPETWPQGLRTAVRIMLTSRQPMFVWWGEELTNLHNDAYASALGRKEESALGRPARELWSEIWDQLEPRVARVMDRDEGTYDERLRLVLHRHGYPEETWWTFSYSPVHDDSGHVGGLLGVCTEETRRILAERSASLLRELATSMADQRSPGAAAAAAARALTREPLSVPFALVYLVDGQEPPVLAAAAGVPLDAVAGGTEGGAIPSLSTAGFPVADVLAQRSPRLVPVPEGFPAPPKDGVPVREALCLPLFAPGERPLAGVLVAGLDPMRDDEARHCEFVEELAGRLAAGLSNARAHEDDRLTAIDRARLYEEAQQEIENRRRAEAALRASERSLREADRRKDEFLAMLAHELRNPLAPLRNGLVLLELAADDPDTVAEAREVMERQLAHLVRLVDDLLDVSRITRGKIELRRERVDVAVALENAIETARPALRDAAHELSVELPHGRLVVDGDPMRLAQVFGNLLHNAAKYTPPGGHIAVSLRRDDADAVVTVADDGIGIAPEMLPRVFEMFAQLDRATPHAAGGLGIGLALVRRLVEMHGGRVEAHSDGEGRGSRFVVRLPLVAAAAKEKAPAEEKRQGEHDVLSVLVVDDNQDAAATLAALLRAWGHDARTANGGAEALASAKERRPDLVILDLWMPGLDGFETCRRLRADPDTRGALIVALTGWGQEESRRKSAEAGFDEHFVKPLEPDSLQALLARAESAR